MRNTPRTAAGLLTVLLIAQTGNAWAFPFIDAGNRDNAPTGAPLGTELPETDAKGLRRQQRLTIPGAPGNPSAWTIVPRLTIQEQITDNALEVTAPRRPDLRTTIEPGISITANTARIDLKFDYAPSLAFHAVNGPLNGITQQLNATGQVTVVPDLMFVDVRGVAGVQSRLGAMAGGGTLGSAASTGANFAGGGQGLNRQNAVQTTSFGVSPYLLKKFSDYGTAKFGVSADVSRSSQVTGFAASPFPTGSGAGAQNLLTTEQIASFTTGEALGRLQNTLSFNMSQSQSKGTFATGATTAATSAAFTSRRMTLNNQVSYALNRTFTLLASIGQQEIQYSQNNAPNIKGLTWNAGVTVTPGPDSSITVTYGHLNGTNSLAVNGKVALTGLTTLSFDYSNTIGTQLENLQNQLNNTVIGANGQAINAVTGGQQFGATNGLGVQNGVFRYDTLNISLSTAVERGTIQANATWSIQTGAGGANSGNNSDIKTLSLSWNRQLWPDLTLSTSASYSLIKRSGSAAAAAGGTSGGTDKSISGSVGLQYTVSESTTLTGRYTFFDRTSRIPGYGLYENILLLALTKQF